MSKAVILSSGGLDSTVVLADAVDRLGAENVVSLSLFYGQRHSKELKCAQEIADYYGVRHIEYDISSAMSHTASVSSLIEGSDVKMNDKSYADQLKEADAPTTEVPLRNGIFLAIAGSYAMSLFPGQDVEVGYGAHADDAAGNAYPDCSPEFAATADQLIQIGSRDHVYLNRPLIHLNKAHVVALGLQLKAPFHLTTSCYHGEEKACSVCGTCRDRVMAFKENGVIDPVKYAEPIDWTGCKKIDYLEDKYAE